MSFMRFLTWLVRAFLFVVLLLFALKNTAPVRLQFFYGAEWQVPLIALLAGFFAVGALLGVMACLAPMFRQRREIAALKRAAASVPPPATPEALPPADLGT